MEKAKLLRYGLTLIGYIQEEHQFGHFPSRFLPNPNQLPIPQIHLGKDLLLISRGLMEHLILDNVVLDHLREMPANKGILGL